MEKTLIVLIGNARGGEDTWETMYTNLKEPFNADLALCFGETSDKSSSLYKNAKFVWEIKEYDNWMDYFNLYFNKDWFKPFAEKFSNSGLLGGITGFRGSAVILLAFRHFLLKNYKHVLMEYDRIILTRSDYYYIDKHPILPNDSLYIVEGEDYWGVCDRHHIFNKDMIDDVLGVCDFFCNTENSNKLCECNSLNLEQVLLHYFNSTWVGEKLKRVKRVQFTVKDTNDTTRWSSGDNPPLPGHPTLKIKYYEEYSTAIKNLNTST